MAMYTYHFLKIIQLIQKDKELIPNLFWKSVDIAGHPITFAIWILIFSGLFMFLALGWAKERIANQILKQEEKDDRFITDLIEEAERLREIVKNHRKENKGNKLLHSLDSNLMNELGTFGNYFNEILKNKGIDKLIKIRSNWDEMKARLTAIEGFIETDLGIKK